MRIWYGLHAKANTRRQQKALSHTMHRDRFVTKYFKTWVARYNKV